MVEKQNIVKLHQGNKIQNFTIKYFDIPVWSSFGQSKVNNQLISAMIHQVKVNPKISVMKIPAKIKGYLDVEIF